MKHLVRSWSRVAFGVALVLIPAQASAQVPPPPPPVAPPSATAAVADAPAVPADYTFASGAGLVFFHVKKPKAADFEAILGRVREALNKAESPMLKQQALNWRIYKSAETSPDVTIFLFAFDPAISTASYDPLLLLAEVLPGEVQPLYERMRDAVIKIERMGLNRIR